MELSGYLKAIRKSWLVIVLLTLVGGGAAYGISKSEAAVYASRLTFYVGTNSAGASTPLDNSQYAQNRAISYAELLSSDQLSSMVAAEPGLGLGANAIGGHIAGTAQLNTVLIDATIKSSSAARANAIAKAVGVEFPKLVDGLDNAQTASTAKATATPARVSVSVVSGPTFNSSPESPRISLNTVLGIAIGLIIGLVVAVLRELFDTSIATREDLEALSGVPTLSTIGFDSSAKSSPLLTHSLGSARAEAIRQLRTNLKFLDAARPVGVLVVTSSVQGEGKTTTAANLAMMFAQSGQRVLLVEADLRHPRLAKYLSLQGVDGLTNVLTGDVAFDHARQDWGSDGLSVLTSGPIPPNPSELLGSEAMTQLLVRLRSEFDLVVIDTPPLLPVTDGAVLGTLADGVLVLCRSGKTKDVQIKAAIRSLQAVNARVLGCVLNMSRGNSQFEVYAAHEKSRPVASAVEPATAQQSAADTAVQPQEASGASAPTPVATRN